MYKIELQDAERMELEAFIKRGRANARNVTRAHILLKSSEGWTLEQIATTFSVSTATVSNVRARYRAGGVSGALHDKVQQNRRRALSGAEEAFIIATACSPVPDGHDHWTVRMLHRRLVELDMQPVVSRGTVHNTLKKTNLSRGNANRGVSRKSST